MIMPIPAMTPVDSSNIEAIGYDEASRELHVRFRTGRRYVYSEVPQETYDRFAQADSKGSFFNREIKPNYSYRED
jgi:KTSC domain